MNTDVKTDLEDLTAVMEDLARRFPNMELKAKIDVAARLKAIAKAAKTIDELVKKEVKSRRKGKAGFVLGELFKAYLNLIPTTRLDQQKLEVKYPKAYADCLSTDDQERVTFEVR